MTTSDISIAEVPAQETLSVTVHTTQDRIGESFGEAMGKLSAYREASGVPMTGPPFARYHSWGDEVVMEVGCTIAGDNSGEGEINRGALPAGKVARVTHTGPYPSLGEAYEAIQTWMKENSHEPAAAPWELYLTDPSTPGLDPADYQTQVLWPIT